VAMQRRLDRAAEILRSFTTDVSETNEETSLYGFNTPRIPSKLLLKCKGIAILWKFKVGVVVGSSHAYGIAIGRLPDGSWSGPAAFRMEALTLGFQMGLESVNMIMVFHRHPEKFLREYFVLSNAAGMVVGNFGFNDDIFNEEAIDDSVYLFSKTSGLYGGLSWDGSVVHIANMQNREYYASESVSSDAILRGQVKPPSSWADSNLLKTLIEISTSMYPKVLSEENSSQNTMIDKLKNDDEKAEEKDNEKEVVPTEKEVTSATTGLTSDSVPAPWVPDSEVSHCHLCKVDFTMFNRKHHCRNCGQIFCGNCSSKQHWVDARKEVCRVCDTCHASLTTQTMKAIDAQAEQQPQQQ